MVKRSTTAFFGVVAALVVTIVIVESGVWIAFLDGGEYDVTSVTVTDGETGAELATVQVRVADTSDKRILGLSNTSSLGTNEGMLFVHDSAGTQGYVMRRMDFPLDIIFIADNGTITTIEHAPTREDGARAQEPFEGHGRYVLEVNRGWANRTGVAVGDTVEIPDAYR